MNAALITITLPTKHKVSGSALAPTDISVVNIRRSDGDNAAAVVGSIANPQTPVVTYTDHSAVPGVEYGYSADCATVADGEGAYCDQIPFELPVIDPPDVPTITSIAPISV